MNWQIEIGNEAELLEKHQYFGSRLGAVRKTRNLARAAAPGLSIVLFRIDESCGSRASKATLSIVSGPQ